MKPANPSLRLTLLALVLLPFAGVTHAGTAANWSFEVLEISQTDRDEALIRLRPRPPGRKFPRSCKTLLVHARFELETWSPTARKAMTRNGHERSLRMLRQAQATGDIVRFGAVGRGFGAIEASPKCEVASRGLQVVVEDDGTPVIYSVFTEP